MKIDIKKSLACCLAGLALCALAFKAEAQVTPTTIIPLTNFPATMPGNSISNLFTLGTIPTNNIIPLRQGQGFASGLTYITTNAGVTTNGPSINWAGSLDGTNFTTQVGWLQQSNNFTNSSGAATNTSLTNFSSALLNNVLFVTPYQIQNASAASNAMTSIQALVSFGNVVPGGYP